MNAPEISSAALRIRGVVFGLLGALLLFGGVASGGPDTLTVRLPDRPVELPRVQIGQQEYVDVRLLAEVVGGRVNGDHRQGKASVQVLSRHFVLAAGSTEVQHREGRIRLAAPSVVREGRLLASADFVPVVLAARYGAEAVSWDRQRLEARVSAPAATVTGVRVGVYSNYTRIVLDTIGQLEWSILGTGPDELLTVVIPRGVLARDIRPLSPKGGVVRQIEPVQQPGGVEVRLVRSQRPSRPRAFALSNPDRIVIDLFDVSSTDTERTALGTTPARIPAAVAGPYPGPPSPRAAPAVPPPAAAEEASPAPGTTTSASLRPASPTPQATGPAPPRSDAAATTGARNGNGARSGNAGGAEPSALTIVLDPGHGGHDTGAIGPSGLMEKDVVLDLAIRLRRLLVEQLGAQVLMTRTEDVFVPLPERTAIANRARADFFISIHANAAMKRSAIGFETFFFSREPSDSDARASAQRENLLIEPDGARGSDQESLLRMTLADMAVTRDMRESSQLAEHLLASLDKLLRVENRGVKSGPFYVLATAAMPAILVESAFITNPREERKLQRTEYRQRLAAAMFEGIAKYKVRYERRVGMAGAVSPARDS